jgi:hypothetical protein
VPPGCAHRNEAAIDVVPKRETCAVAERLKLPAHIVVAPAVLEQIRCLGARDLRLRDLRGRRSDRRKPDGADRSETPVSIKRRPFTQTGRVGQCFPHFLRRMTQFADQNQCPLFSILADFGAGGRARHIFIAIAHRFFPFRCGTGSI